MNSLLNISLFLLRDGITVFGRDIKFYGIIIAIGMLIAIFMARRLCKHRGINPDEIYTLALIVIPFAILGARSYYCIFSEDSYTFVEFWKIWEGGLAILGGVIGGIIAIIIYCAWKKNFKIIPVLFDIIVPGLIFAQCMGRWGNFFNQEAFGYEITNTKLQWFPFGVFIEETGGWHLATFFYESMWNLIGTVLLIFVFYKSKHTGTTTATYLIYYGIGRYWIEGLRTDSLYFWNTNIRISQALSIVMILIGIVILGYNYIKSKKNASKN